MSGWVLWVIAACAFGVGDRLTTRFFLAPFAVGAVLAAVVDVAGAGELASWIAFVVVALLSMRVMRPIARSRRQVSPPIPTGSAALIGQDAVVLERIANNEGIGCVKINGAVWTARAYDDDHVIETGTRVQVIQIKGATALVTE